VLLVSDSASGVGFKSTDLNGWVVDDRGESFFGEQLVKATIVEDTLCSDNTFEKDTFDTVLLNQQFIEAEETHQV